MCAHSDALVACCHMAHGFCVCVHSHSSICCPAVNIAAHETTCNHTMIYESLTPCAQITNRQPLHPSHCLIIAPHANQITPGNSKTSRRSRRLPSSSVCAASCCASTMVPRRYPHTSQDPTAHHRHPGHGGGGDGRLHQRPQGAGHQLQRCPCGVFRRRVERGGRGADDCRLHEDRWGAHP